VCDGTVRARDPIFGRDDRFATMETRRDFRIRSNDVVEDQSAPTACVRRRSPSLQPPQRILSEDGRNRGHDEGVPE
jgi:hypothetical protein